MNSPLISVIVPVYNTAEYIEKTADGEIKSMLEKYNNGARCTSGYKCKNPCGFKEGIDLSREI